MKNYIILFIFLTLISQNSYSQVTCESRDTSIVPITPYTNAYLYFDGVNDFVRTRDLEQLEFIYATTDSFYISVRLKITGTTAQYIMGKYEGSNNTGWILSFNTPDLGKVSFAINFPGRCS